MKPRDFGNIYTTRNSCRDMALKLPQYFYLLIEKPLGLYFRVWPSYSQVVQYNQKTPIPVSVPSR